MTARAIAILRTPLVAIPTLISKINHDYLHWPFKEKHVYQEWKANSGWGRLFQRYKREGHLADHSPVALTG